MPADARAPGLPFWIHQVVEYLLGVLLITQAVQTSRPLVPVLLGLGVIVLAGTADGPVAAFRVVPRPLHRALDVVTLIVIVAVAVVFRDDLGTTGLVFAALAAAGLFGLVLRTDYSPKRTRPARSGAPPAVDEPSAAPADPPPPASKGERVSRAAGRALGKGIRSYQDPPAPPSSTPPAPEPAE